MIDTLIGPTEINFLINIGLCIALGLMIGFERETRRKDVGISTNILIITGAMVFTFISHLSVNQDSTRIAAQIVTGVGFLGAGLIIRDGSSIKNVTTAAGIWVGAGIGMAIGYQFYMIAIITAFVATLVPRIPSYRRNEVVKGTE